jgi:hypothetical protein
MKKYVVSMMITMLVLLNLASQASAYPAETPEFGQAVRPMASSDCRNLDNLTLAEIPSRRVDYVSWNQLSKCMKLTVVSLVIPVTGSTRPSSYAAFKELQADLFSGK